ncbi:MAG: hypothetical protein Q8P31_03360 [Bacillota bacterium]|nr:hypothetical protein [Bacillota bacterium]
MMRGRGAFWLGLIITTTVLGIVWATSVGAVALSITLGGTDGKLVQEIRASNPGTTFTVTRGKAQVIAGINLYEVVGVAPEFHDRLVVRVYILNPGDMKGIFGSPNTYVEILATQPDNPDVVYASTFLSRQLADGVIRPSLPFGVYSFRIRASVVVPGGSPPGAQEENLGELRFRLEVSPK